jgi:hypothetical protein
MSRNRTCPEALALPVETLYMNRCLENPQISESSMNVCDEKSNKIVNYVWNNNGFCQGKGENTVNFTTNVCVPGPDSSGAIFKCSSKPFSGPKGKNGAYGQVLECANNCTNSNCNYRWFEPGKCIPQPFGGSMEICDLITNRYFLQVRNLEQWFVLILESNLGV